MLNKISMPMPVEQSINCPVIIGANLYDFSAWLPSLAFQQIVIITDHTVKKLYGLELQKCLQQAGYKNLLFSFPAGEKFKTYKTKQMLENNMQLHGCNRDTLIIALGGGIVGDLTGFIAATYLRGIPYIQIPTTLLAMVDSSIGGKTGINTIYGKNLIGVIYQPLCVVIDIILLKTLSKKNIINGLIEAIKMFLTYDAKSLHYTESHLRYLIQGSAIYLKEIVTKAVKIKAAVVGRDEKEQGERSVLNFGHTIGHALEKLSNYTLLHGYAVAYGILVEANISYLLDLLNSKALLIIKKLLAQLGIYGKDLQKYNPAEILQATKIDKKVRLGKVHYTLLSDISSIYINNGNYVHPVTDKIVKLAIKKTIKE
ncbi:3-dehydroquinate synthase [Rickettsiella endosymbiont of Aleochara curtula]|uniref:3-dehydroquinate synthase n=1 Tax=Rickettsiella endosymbiont of Aleochara curtula TaxID=3077936 RepID=UPI00313A92E1